MKVIITRGLVASGKTTWSKQKCLDSGGNWKRVNKDDLRAMLDDGKFSRNNEKNILDVRDMIILTLLTNKFSVIIDDTNLCDKHIHRIKSIIGNEATVEIKEFDESIKTCIERDSKRDNAERVGEDVIKDMAKKYMTKQYIKEFGYVPNKDMSKAIIFDIDGTLARNVARSPYDYTKVLKDGYVEPVWKILRNYIEDGYKIIFMSGRSDECREDTVKWLQDGIYGQSSLARIMPMLFMRSQQEQDDGVSDVIVKKRLFDSIKDKYNIEAVFDDRLRVIKMWEEQGLFVFNVNQGNKEF